MKNEQSIMNSLLQPPADTSSPTSLPKINPLRGAGSHIVAHSPPNMPFPIRHVPFSHLAHLFCPEHDVDTFTYLSDHMRVKFQKSANMILM
jgi:hypothetical protein